MAITGPWNLEKTIDKNKKPKYIISMNASITLFIAPRDLMTLQNGYAVEARNTNNGYSNLLSNGYSNLLSNGCSNLLQVSFPLSNYDVLERVATLGVFTVIPKTKNYVEPTENWSRQ